MSRIRSVHPGFFTDERLVSTSFAARLLFIGLGVEADDKGIFEWKPVTLKMRIFPADNVDVSSLLQELMSAGVIETYEIEGRHYGAIRNFRRHQRPKTPNDIHPIPDHFRNYVGLTDAVSETPDDKQPPFPPKGEKRSQMEDGGEGVKENNIPIANAIGADARSLLFDKGLKSLMRQTGKPEGQSRKLLGHWLKMAQDDAAKILTKINQSEADRRADPVAWIEAAIRWEDDPRKRLKGFCFG